MTFKLSRSRDPVNDLRSLHPTPWPRRIAVGSAATSWLVALWMMSIALQGGGAKAWVFGVLAVINVVVSVSALIVAIEAWAKEIVAKERLEASVHPDRSSERS